jgi:hypothetical protein
MSTTTRGLGYEHQKQRRLLLPYAIGRVCPLCPYVMTKAQAYAPVKGGHGLDLDHSLPRSLGGTVGDRIVHAWCNRSRGNGLSRAHRARVYVLVQSREW